MKMSSAKWRPFCSVEDELILLMLKPDNPGKLGGHHCCWYPGSLGHQVISSHDIEYVKWSFMRTDFVTWMVVIWMDNKKYKYINVSLVTIIIQHVQGRIMLTFTSRDIFIDHTVIVYYLSFVCYAWNAGASHLTHTYIFFPWSLGISMKCESGSKNALATVA